MKIAAIAQLGERQTEDLKVSGSIPDRGINFCLILLTSKANYENVFYSMLTQMDPYIF